MEIPNKLYSFNDNENTVATNELTATIDIRNQKVEFVTLTKEEIRASERQKVIAEQFLFGF